MAVCKEKFDLETLANERGGGRTTPPGWGWAGCPTPRQSSTNLNKNELEIQESSTESPSGKNGKGKMGRLWAFFRPTLEKKDWFFGVLGALPNWSKHQKMPIFELLIFGFPVPWPAFWPKSVPKQKKNPVPCAHPFG